MSGKSRGKPQKGSLHNGHSEPENFELRHGGQIQNVKAAKVYVFGEEDLDDEELMNDEIESCELRARGASKDATKKEGDLLAIERPIVEGETLQKIAVKYCCEIADLKRINNLMTEQDFFALKIIKVPVKKHSLVREKLEEDIRQNSSAYGVQNGNILDSILAVDETNGSESDWGDMDQENDSERQELIRTVSIRNTICNQGEEARNFLKKMDTDIKNILTSTKSSRKKNLDEVRSSLTCRRIYPMKRRDSFMGADCGIKIGTVIAVIIIVAIVTPLAYYLYYEHIAKQQESNNHDR